MRIYRTLLFIIFISILIVTPTRLAHDELIEKWAESTYTAMAIVVPSCSVNSSANLSFPDLDPSMGDVHIEKMVADFRCTLGCTWKLTMGNGLYEKEGSKRMKHEFRESHIPYSLGFGADSGAGEGYGIYDNVIVEGDVYSADLSGAVPGNYSDTVIITLTPSAEY